MLDIGLNDEEVLSELILELIDKRFVWYVNCYDIDVFIIKEHFLSLSKSKLNIRKAIDEGKSSLYQEELRELYEPSDFQPSLSFTPPTPDEVTRYALDIGYIVNGYTFVDYYASNDWYNKNNKKIRSWKQTLKRVWCREENKLIAVAGAPEGFEYFYIEAENGNRISPEGWRNGKPTHSNFMHAELLIESFNRCTTKQQENT